MSDALLLTPTELAFLACLRQDDERDVLGCLGYAAEDREPRMLIAGLQSLVVRGLAHAGTEAVELTPEVGAIQELLQGATLVATVAAYGDSEPSACCIVEDPATRIMLSPDGSGLIGVVALENKTPVADLLADAARTVFTSGEVDLVRIAAAPNADPTRRAQTELTQGVDDSDFTSAVAQLVAS